MPKFTIKCPKCSAEWEVNYLNGAIAKDRVKCHNCKLRFTIIYSRGEYKSYLPPLTEYQRFGDMEL